MKRRSISPHSNRRIRIHIGLNHAEKEEEHEERVSECAKGELPVKTQRGGGDGGKFCVCLRQRVEETPKAAASGTDTPLFRASSRLPPQTSSSPPSAPSRSFVFLLKKRSQWYGGGKDGSVPPRSGMPSVVNDVSRLPSLVMAPPPLSGSSFPSPSPSSSVSIHMAPPSVSSTLPPPAQPFVAPPPLPRCYATLRVPPLPQEADQPPHHPLPPFSSSSSGEANVSHATHDRKKEESKESITDESKRNGAGGVRASLLRGRQDGDPQDRMRPVQWKKEKEMHGPATTTISPSSSSSLPSYTSPLLSCRHRFVVNKVYHPLCGGAPSAPSFLPPRMAPPAMEGKREESRSTVKGSGRDDEKTEKSPSTAEETKESIPNEASSRQSSRGSASGRRRASSVVFTVEDSTPPRRSSSPSSHSSIHVEWTQKEPHGTPAEEAHPPPSHREQTTTKEEKKRKEKTPPPVVVVPPTTTTVPNESAAPTGKENRKTSVSFASPPLPSSPLLCPPSSISRGDRFQPPLFHSPRENSSPATFLRSSSWRRGTKKPSSSSSRTDSSSSSPTSSVRISSRSRALLQHVCAAAPPRASPSRSSITSSSVSEKSGSGHRDADAERRTSVSYSTLSQPPPPPPSLPSPRPVSSHVSRPSPSPPAPAEVKAIVALVSPTTGKKHDAVQVPFTPHFTAAPSTVSLLSAHEVDYVVPGEVGKPSRASSGSACSSGPTRTTPPPDPSHRPRLYHPTHPMDTTRLTCTTHMAQDSHDRHGHTPHDTPRSHSGGPTRTTARTKDGEDKKGTPDAASGGPPFNRFQVLRVVSMPSFPLHRLPPAAVMPSTKDSCGSASITSSFSSASTSLFLPSPMSGEKRSVEEERSTGQKKKTKKNHQKKKEKHTPSFRVLRCTPLTLRRPSVSTPLLSDSSFSKHEEDEKMDTDTPMKTEKKGTTRASKQVIQVRKKTVFYHGGTETSHLLLTPHKRRGREEEDEAPQKRGTRNGSGGCCCRCCYGEREGRSPGNPQDPPVETFHSEKGQTTQMVEKQMGAKKKGTHPPATPQSSSSSRDGSRNSPCRACSSSRRRRRRSSSVSTSRSCADESECRREISTTQEWKVQRRKKDPLVDPQEANDMFSRRARPSLNSASKTATKTRQMQKFLQDRLRLSSRNSTASIDLPPSHSMPQTTVTVTSTRREGIPGKKGRRSPRAMDASRGQVSISSSPSTPRREMTKTPRRNEEAQDTRSSVGRPASFIRDASLFVEIGSVTGGSGSPPLSCSPSSLHFPSFSSSSSSSFASLGCYPSTHGDEGEEKERPHDDTWWSEETQRKGSAIAPLPTPSTPSPIAPRALPTAMDADSPEVAAPSLQVVQDPFQGQSSFSCPVCGTGTTTRQETTSAPPDRPSLPPSSASLCNPEKHPSRSPHRHTRIGHPEENNGRPPSGGPLRDVLRVHPPPPDRWRHSAVVASPSSSFSSSSASHLSASEGPSSQRHGRVSILLSPAAETPSPPQEEGRQRESRSPQKGDPRRHPRVSSPHSTGSPPLAREHSPSGRKEEQNGGSTSADGARSRCSRCTSRGGDSSRWTAGITPTRRTQADGGTSSTRGGVGAGRIPDDQHPPPFQEEKRSKAVHRLVCSRDREDSHAWREWEASKKALRGHAMDDRRRKDEMEAVSPSFSSSSQDSVLPNLASTPSWTSFSPSPLRIPYKGGYQHFFAPKPETFSPLSSLSRIDKVGYGTNAPFYSPSLTSFDPLQSFYPIPSSTRHSDEQERSDAHLYRPSLTRGNSKTSNGRERGSLAPFPAHSRPESLSNLVEKGDPRSTSSTKEEAKTVPNAALFPPFSSPALPPSSPHHHHHHGRKPHTFVVDALPSTLPSLPLSSSPVEGRGWNFSASGDVLMTVSGSHPTSPSPTPTFSSPSLPRLVPWWMSTSSTFISSHSSQPDQERREGKPITPNSLRRESSLSKCVGGRSSWTGDGSCRTSPRHFKTDMSSTVSSSVKVDARDMWLKKRFRKSLSFKTSIPFSFSTVSAPSFNSFPQEDEELIMGMPLSPTLSYNTTVAH